ncbi:Uncharacterised protein [Streptococcus pneumoniae]|nr:Uncharacterised protein [Streptococcus pneumoniae]CRG03939.1 Uncharacterised protein [Streptococcus pneumoniae]
MLHDIISNRLTTETIMAHAISMFPENIDAVVKVDIKPEKAQAATPAQ